MSTPTAAAKDALATSDAELERQLEQAERDFASGDFVDITIEDLERCILAGEWPWSCNHAEHLGAETSGQKEGPEYVPKR